MDVSRRTENVQVHVLLTATEAKMQKMVNELNVLSVRLILVMKTWYLLYSFPSVLFVLR